MNRADAKRARLKQGLAAPRPVVAVGAHESHERGDLLDGVVHLAADRSVMGDQFAIADIKSPWAERALIDGQSVLADEDLEYGVDAKLDRLDVAILQRRVVAKLCPTQKEQEAILYTKDDHEALNWVLEGTGTAALLLNATKVSEVQAVASAGERMPHKSTYFFPKPLTGLVINVMEES